MISELSPCVFKPFSKRSGLSPGSLLAFATRSLGYIWKVSRMSPLGLQIFFQVLFELPRAFSRFTAGLFREVSGNSPERSLGLFQVTGISPLGLQVFFRLFPVDLRAFLGLIPKDLNFLWAFSRGFCAYSKGFLLKSQSILRASSGQSPATLCVNLEHASNTK